MFELNLKRGNLEITDDQIKGSNERALIQRSLDFYKAIKTRRTVRKFLDRKVPRAVIENAILSAGTAPNGANKQPWKFVAIESQKIKEQLKNAVEAVEKDFYDGRASQTWLDDLKKFGTNASKPYLTKAPYIIAVFSQLRGKEEGEKTYYPIESTGIATGMLLTSLHLSGLSTLTHTPRPMKFLNELLEVEDCYRPFLLVITGYPELPLDLPEINKKALSEISKFV